MSFMPAVDQSERIEEGEVEGVDFPKAEEMGKSPDGKYQLKELKIRHKRILSLVVQGVPHKQIANMADITPEYITMMLRMPICQDYLKGLCEAADVQLEALLPQSVEAIKDALTQGDIDQRLKGARLHLEATKRIGGKGHVAPNGDTQDARLERLSHRLIDLLQKQRAQGGDIIDVNVQPVGQNSDSEGAKAELRRIGHGASSAHEADRDGLRDGQSISKDRWTAWTPPGDSV